MKVVWKIGGKFFDLYFKDEESASQFCNFFLTFEGRNAPPVVGSNRFHNVGENIDKKIYPFTLDNCVEHDIVKSYLALFPEEEDV
jgi:hypothetical protein